ncbi:Ribosome maturation factor RimP [Candidatus Mikella endobia]|uniref:Ribosome maturation factor RimP n=1 Tax=Candidatus Mikella endobia TaxID=1778264 RepID=A0A143WPM3_9ENTR|nr:hypothetical protein [Candidatus Mikella endobia]CUX95660.1 Ribosome maturation factor RimP [Candidatus Mikella endobia]
MTTLKQKLIDIIYEPIKILEFILVVIDFIRNSQSTLHIYNSEFILMLRITVKNKLLEIIKTVSSKIVTVTVDEKYKLANNIQKENIVPIVVMYY